MKSRILRECRFLASTFMGILANTNPFSEFLFSEAIVSYTIAFSKRNSEKGPVIYYFLINAFYA
jgi:hypothetical protein